MKRKKSISRNSKKSMRRKSVKRSKRNSKKSIKRKNDGVKCQYCAFDADTETELNNHTILHRDEALLLTENPTQSSLPHEKFKCTHTGCTYTTSRLDHLTNHIRIHTGKTT